MSQNLTTDRHALPRDFSDEVRAVIGAFAIVRKMENLMEEEAFSVNLTKQERRMVLFLDPPRRMGELAKWMGALPSSVTAMADSLADRGLLVRQRDPQDGRAWQLALTDSGRDARDETFEKVEKIFRTESNLTGKEIRTYADLAIKALPDDFFTDETGEDPK
ncbi:MarR family transcriptional regulator [Shimia isoporae]|uniref:MarR family transcriptional regulator n=1 Tax=Shimia isoporae TaxID=647720 RepID=A0A4R1NCJ3_9RHOB|nr:MarR family winged helix-turn-helix transcriptional regulator [Shimia isoporae]TCL01363.1 MarR family transcriptional regulator [Shimia isoporae]